MKLKIELQQLQRNINVISDNTNNICAILAIGFFVIFGVLIYIAFEINNIEKPNEDENAIIYEGCVQAKGESSLLVDNKPFKFSCASAIEFINIGDVIKIINLGGWGSCGEVEIISRNISICGGRK